MRKKSIAFLLALLMLVSLLGSQLTAFAADTASAISVQFNNGSAPSNSNSIYAKYKVTNTSSSPVNLANVKLRYYYTQDADKTLTFWCDHAGYLNGNSYMDVTKKVTGTFVAMPAEKVTATADHYMEVSFASDAGSLPAGGSIEVQTRFARNDWSNFDQSNDYSYKQTGSYVDWNQVTAYVGGTLVYGVEPPPGPNTPVPTINPTQITGNANSFTSDAKITLNPDGATFKGISELQSSQYSVNQNVVTLPMSYLNSLAKGTYTLTFDFGVATKPTLTIVIGGTPPPPGFTVAVDNVTGDAGGTVTVPVRFSDIAKIATTQSVGTCNFYLNFDSTILSVDSIEAGSIVTNAGVNFASNVSGSSISFLFLDNTIGNELIKADGVFANIKFKISATATQGSVAKITFKDGGAFGDGNMVKIADVVKKDGSVTVGNPPQVPVINPTSATITEGKATSDIVVGVQANGKTFNGITGLTANTQYKVNSDGSVSLLTTYLNSLKPGTYTLVFDFGLGSQNPTFTLTVVSDGKFKVSVGTATGLPGDTVKVPVSFANLAKIATTQSVGTCNFYLNYDATQLDVVSVDAGSIVTNAGVNFASNVTSGSISFLFLDNTIGNELIKADGTFATITFKIKADATQGTKPVTFKDGGAFGDGAMVKITDMVKENGGVTVGNPPIGPVITPSTATYDKSAPTDVKVTLTPNGYTFKGITGLTAGTDYTVANNVVTFTSSYLNSIAAGTTKSLTFDFGATNNPTFTLTVISGGKFKVSVGTATGLPGDTVKVPVTFANLAKIATTQSVGTCNFYLNYDATQLDVVSVDAGSIVTNAGVNFASNVTSGSISFLFLDNTIGNELIKADGTFATITFKIRSDAKPNTTTSVSFKDGGAFGDGAMVKITDMVKENGSVTIGTPSQVPVITPSTATYDKSAPTDVKVTLTPNGYTFKGITGLTAGTDYTVANNVVTFTSSYLNSIAVNTTKSLVFDFGATNNPVFALTVKDSGSTGLNVTVGTAEAKSGESVIVPVSFKNVASAGKVGTCNFYLTYDPTLLEVASVTPGSIVTNAGVNFASSYGNGTISFLFLDNTLGNELITSDGEFANIKFNLKTVSAKTVASVNFKDGGAFGDAGMVKIAKVDKVNGSVTIDYIDVVPTTPTITPSTATYDKYVPSDVKVTLTPNGNTFKGITGLTAGTDYTVANNVVTFTSSYLNSIATDTTKSLTFDFGVTNNPVFALTVKDSKPQTTGLGVTVGTASGISGDSVIVPVSLKNVASVGKVGTCNFYLTYDPTLLEVASVTPGSIVTNAGVNFASSYGNGTISFLFLDNTIGNELITSDGEFANIKFNLKTVTAKTTASVNFKDGGAFGDANMVKIAKVDKVNGSVTIDVGSVVPTTPTISSSAATYDKYVPTDVKVTLTPNGNTFKGITGLTAGTDYTVANNVVTFSSSYLNSIAAGTTKSLTFDFGVTNNPVFALTVKDSKPQITGLGIALGSTAGKTGDTITVPINLTNVVKSGNVGTCNFYLGFDTSLLQAVEVKAGDIVLNPGVNFASSINSTNGTISILFLDNTIGNQLITSDGLFATITFKVLGTSSTTTPISFKTGGAFGDGNMVKIANTTFTNGSVKLN